MPGLFRAVLLALLAGLVLAAPAHAREQHFTADATLAAEPITTYDGSHKGADAYRQLARELIARGGAA